MRPSDSAQLPADFYRLYKTELTRERIYHNHRRVRRQVRRIKYVARAGLIRIAPRYGCLARATAHNSDNLSHADSTQNESGACQWYVRDSGSYSLVRGMHGAAANGRRRALLADARRRLGCGHAKGSHHRGKHHREHRRLRAKICAHSAAL